MRNGSRGRPGVPSASVWVTPVAAAQRREQGALRALVEVFAANDQLGPGRPTRQVNELGDLGDMRPLGVVTGASPRELTALVVGLDAADSLFDVGVRAGHDGDPDVAGTVVAAIRRHLGACHRGLLGEIGEHTRGDRAHPSIERRVRRHRTEQSPPRTSPMAGTPGGAGRRSTRRGGEDSGDHQLGYLGQTDHTHRSHQHRDLRGVQSGWQPHRHRQQGLHRNRVGRRNR